MSEFKRIEKAYHTGSDLTQREWAWMDMCAMRNIGSPCPKCSGYGVRTYASTATWMGGVGGQALTSGICDSCWGSGDTNRPWLNLRELRKP
jgi:hypothetical protein